MPTGELAGILEQSAGGLIAIDGMAGVGKTTLAVHAAHRLLGQGRPLDRRSRSTCAGTTWIGRRPIRRRCWTRCCGCSASPAPSCTGWT